MNIGKAIKKVRKEKGLTQCELAKISGITQTYLSQIEANNLRHPSMEILVNISAGLDIPFFVLVFISVEQTDIPGNKKFLYKKYIEPIIKSLVGDFFIPHKS